MRHKKFVFLILAAALPVLGILLDRDLSRPSRIGLELQQDRLMAIRDAIQSFKLDREHFPQALSELVPGYISTDLLRFHPSVQSDTQEDLCWDPQSGMLSGTVDYRIHGLFPRQVPLRLHVWNLPVARDLLTGEMVFRRASTQTVLGRDAIVVEAERFHFMTYGWEIGVSEDASCRGYLHLKEGLGDITYANIEFDPKMRSGDFYNITRDQRPLEARCYFMAPRAGTYRISARTMAHRSSCSNMILLHLNDGPAMVVGRNGTAPFVWLWHQVGTVEISAGVNFLSFRTYQDDVKVDQIVLTPEDLALDAASTQTFGGGYQAPLLLPNDIPPVTLSLSVSSRTLTATPDPAVIVYVHQQISPNSHSVLYTALDQPGNRTRERASPVILPDAAGLTSFPYALDMPRPLEKKEYLLRCQLRVDSERVLERTVVFFHGFDWSILGPLPYMTTSDADKPEQDIRPKNNYAFGASTNTWHPYDEAHTDHLCLLDFGQMFFSNTYHALPSVSLYGYTEVDTKEAGDYLLKTQGDDQLIVWINGARVVTTGGYRETAIRSARETPVRLLAGRNRILFRLNQEAGQWQAGIRIRTADDQIADVKGIPFAGQDVDFYKAAP